MPAPRELLALCRELAVWAPALASVLALVTLVLVKLVLVTLVLPVPEPLALALLVLQEPLALASRDSLASSRLVLASLAFPFEALRRTRLD